MEGIPPGRLYRRSQWQTTITPPLFWNSFAAVTVSQLDSTVLYMHIITNRPKVQMQFMLCIMIISWLKWNQGEHALDLKAKILCFCAEVHIDNLYPQHFPKLLRENCALALKPELCSYTHAHTKRKKWDWEHITSGKQNWMMHENQS